VPTTGETAAAPTAKRDEITVRSVALAPVASQRPASRSRAASKVLPKRLMG
jgi:hypothetical protein